MKYKPLEIEATEDLGIVTKDHAESYENKITRTLMKERGLNNVRGGDLRDVDEYIKGSDMHTLKTMATDHFNLRREHYLIHALSLKSELFYFRNSLHGP